MVHTLCWVDQHGFAATPTCGALGELDRVAHGVDADFFARLALFVVDISLRLLGQRPTQFNHHRFGHQNTKIGVAAHVDGVAAGAGVAGAVLSRRIAQPSADELQRQLVLPQTRRPLQQPSVAALFEQGFGLLGYPRRGGLGGDGGLFCAHARNPLALTAASTSAQTASRLWLALILAKRDGFSSMRC